MNALFRRTSNSSQLKTSLNPKEKILDRSDIYDSVKKSSKITIQDFQHEDRDSFLQEQRSFSNSNRASNSGAAAAKRYNKRYSKNRQSVMATAPTNIGNNNVGPIVGNSATNRDSTSSSNVSRSSTNSTPEAMASLDRLRKNSCISDYKNALINVSKRLSDESLLYEQDNKIYSDLEAENGQSSKYHGKNGQNGKNGNRSQSVFSTATKSVLTQMRRSTLAGNNYDKVLGSEFQVVQQNEQLKREKSFVMHPYSTVKAVWDFLTLFVMVVNLVYFPIDECFLNRSKEFYDYRIIWGWVGTFIS